MSKPKSSAPPSAGGNAAPTDQPPASVDELSRSYKAGLISTSSWQNLKRNGGSGGAGGIFSFVAVRSGDPGVIVVVAGPRDAVRGEFVGAGATHEFTLKPYGVASAVASFFVPGNELTTANTAVLLYRADGSTVE